MIGQFVKTIEAINDVVERQRMELSGWKRTALAMRDKAIMWNRDHQDRSDEIQELYFNAAMGISFAPGDEFED